MVWLLQIKIYKTTKFLFLSLLFSLLMIVANFPFSKFEKKDFPPDPPTRIESVEHRYINLFEIRITTLWTLNVTILIYYFLFVCLSRFVVHRSNNQINEFYNDSLG